MSGAAAAAGPADVALYDAQTGEQLTDWTPLRGGRAQLTVPTDRMLVTIVVQPGQDAPLDFGETLMRRPGDVIDVDVNPPVILHRGGV